MIYADAILYNKTQIAKAKYMIWNVGPVLTNSNIAMFAKMNKIKTNKNLIFQIWNMNLK